MRPWALAETGHCARAQPLGFRVRRAVAAETVRVHATRLPGHGAARESRAMNDTPPRRLDSPASPALPETPHELPFDRGLVDALVDRVRSGEQIDLLAAVLEAVDWSAFGTAEGEPLAAASRDELRAYYRRKWADVGPLYLAELLSTEFMTEQRARGDVVFSERLLELGRTEPDLWQEIRQFFRRKEMVTALLAAAHEPTVGAAHASTADDEDEEELWE